MKPKKPSLWLPLLFALPFLALAALLLGFAPGLADPLTAALKLAVIP